MSATPDRPRFSLVVVWPDIALAVVYLIVVGSSFVGLYSPFLRLTSIVIVAGALAAWLGAAWLRSSWGSNSRFLWGFALAILVFLVCSVTSRSPRIGLENAAWAALLAGLYLLLERLVAVEALRSRILTFIAVAAVTIGCAYVVEVLRLWAEWWSLVGRIASPPLRPLSEALTFGNPSVVMVVETMFIASAVGWVGVATNRRRIISSSLVAMGALVALLTGSRSGWFAATIAFSAVGFLYVARSRGRLLMWLRRVPRSGVAVALVAAVVALVLVAPGVLYRVGSGGEDLRVGYVVASVRMFASSPIVGVGPGMWPIERIAQTSVTESDYYIPYAHNIYVQALAEFGVLALLVGVVTLVVIIRLIGRALRDDDPLRRRMAWTATFVIVYFACHQLLDSFVQVPAALLGFALPLAVLDATDSGTDAMPWQVSHRRLLTFAVSIVTGAAVLALFVFESRASVANDALVALNANDVPAAIASGERSVAEDPGMPPYELTLGIAEVRTGDLVSARNLLRSAAEFDDLPNTWIALAAVELALGDRSAARIALDRGERLGVQQPVVALDAGWLRLAIGDRQRAIEDLARSVVAAPNLAEASAWTADPTLADVWPEVLASSLGQLDGPTRWGVALSSGDVDRARSLADDLSPAQTRDARLIIDAWAGGRDSDAYKGLLTAAAARPLDENLVVWATRTAKHFDDQANGDRLRRWVIIMSGGFSPSAGRMDIAIQGRDSAPDSVLAGSNATFFGHYTYRRPTPGDLTVLGLPVITLQ